MRTHQIAFPGNVGVMSCFVGDLCSLSALVVNMFHCFRLACSQTPEMIQFFIHTESTLFCYRVTCMREEELQHTVKNIEKLHKILKQQQSQSDEILCSVL